MTLDYAFKITENLYKAKIVVATTSLANSVFSLYAVYGLFGSGHAVMALIAALFFFFNVLVLLFSFRQWNTKEVPE